MARYLLVKVKDDSRRYNSPFGKIRNAIHRLSQKEGFGLADFGTDMPFVTEYERREVEKIFERVMDRAKEHQRMVETENPYYSKKRKR